MIDEVRILSLWQPWAQLMADGRKLVETRSWSTRYRGWIAIHAAKKFPPEARAFASGLDYDELRFGVILGLVWLNGVTLTENYRPGVLTHLELSYGDYTPGRFAWHTRSGSRRRFLEPMPYKGGQGLRKLPENVAARLLGRKCA